MTSADHISAKLFIRIISEWKFSLSDHCVIESRTSATFNQQDTINKSEQSQRQHIQSNSAKNRPVGKILKHDNTSKNMMYSNLK